MSTTSVEVLRGLVPGEEHYFIIVVLKNNTPSSKNYSPYSRMAIPISVTPFHQSGKIPKCTQPRNNSTSQQILSRTPNWFCRSVRVTSTSVPNCSPASAMGGNPNAPPSCSPFSAPDEPSGDPSCEEAC